MLTIPQFMYHRLNEDSIYFNDTSKVNDDICYLCGGDTNNKGLALKKALSSNFTNGDLAKYHQSNSICEACSFFLKQSFDYFNSNKNKISKLTPRNFSWVITDKIIYPTITKDKDKYIVSNLINPEIMRNFMLSIQEYKQFVILYSTSGQKHLFFRANQINISKNNIEVVFEENLINFDYNIFLNLIEVIESLLAFDLSKTSIQNNKIYIKGLSISKLQHISNLIDSYKYNPIFDFILKISVNKGDTTEWETYKNLKQILKQESTILTQTTSKSLQQVKSSTQYIEVETQQNSAGKSKKTTGAGLQNSSKKRQEDQTTLFDL